MKIVVEIITLFIGGVFGALVGAHFKTGSIEPWISRAMSVLASFIVILFVIDHGYLEFSRKAFSSAAGIAFVIETMGQNEISKFLSKVFKRKVEDAVGYEKKKK